MGYSGDLAGGSGNLFKNLLIEGLGTFIFSYVFLSGFVGRTFLVANSGILFPAVLTVLSWVCFPLSGAHFNPCVTLALLIKNKIEAKKGAFYILVQLAATFVASLILYLNLTEDIYNKSVKTAYWNARSPSSRIINDKKYLTFIYEFIGTFVFVLIFFAANIGKGGTNVTAGFMIALGFLFANSMISSATCGVLNPFLYICPRLLTMDMPDILWYILGPPLGAVLAAFVYEPLIGDNISEDETPLVDLN